MQWTVWNSALCAEPPGFAFERPLSAPFKLFSGRKPALGRRGDHTFADPFLLARGGALYLFCEVQADAEPGRIEAWRTTDLNAFDHLGVVLREPHHLSYPFVLEQEGEVWLLPESQAAGEVALYRFADFPRDLRKIRVLLEGDYLDSSLLFHEGLWYLFTTSPRGLELYCAADLLAGAFQPHPLNSLTSDPRYSRGGGGVIRIGGGLYRIAQDCSGDYGRNINVFVVDLLNGTEYRETLLRENYLANDSAWNALGGHHLSIAHFAGRDIVAVDGRQEDLLVNRALGRLRDRLNP